MQNLEDYFEKEDFLENLHVLSSFVRLKSVVIVVVFKLFRSFGFVFGFVCLPFVNKDQDLLSCSLRRFSLFNASMSVTLPFPCTRAPSLLVAPGQLFYVLVEGAS